MNRWYDKHESLGRNLDLMKDMKPPRRIFLLEGINKVIRDYKPTLLDDFVLEFPMDIYQKRWYDKDPYLWITINGLSYGDKKLWEAVAVWLESKNR
jgi:hypothetical protein